MPGLRAFAFTFAVVSFASTAVAEDAVKTDQPAAPANPPIQVSRGDSWAYDLRDDVTDEAKGSIVFEVTKITDAGIETQVTRQIFATHAKTTSSELFDARWRMKDNAKFLFSPHLDSTGAPDDLQVGKSWSFKYEAQRKGAAQTQEFSGVGKVAAWERVTLPNGAAYDAFKIDVAAAPRSAPAGRKVELHAMMWFAPAVNRVVKRVDESRVDGKLRDASEQTLRAYKPAAKI